MRLGSFWTISRIRNAELLSEKSLCESPTHSFRESSARTSYVTILMSPNPLLTSSLNSHPVLSISLTMEISFLRNDHMPCQSRLGYWILKENTPLLGGAWSDLTTCAPAKTNTAVPNTGNGVRIGTLTVPERHPIGWETGTRKHYLDLRGPTHQAVAIFLSMVVRKCRIILSNSSREVGLNEPSGLGPIVTVQQGQREALI